MYCRMRWESSWGPMRSGGNRAATAYLCCLGGRQRDDTHKPCRGLRHRGLWRRRSARSLPTLRSRVSTSGATGRGRRAEVRRTEHASHTTMSARITGSQERIAMATRGNDALDQDDPAAASG